jgi:hypothetical protein
MEINNENPVIAIAAWINSNAKTRPVSVMMEQKGTATSLIGFMNGNKNRRTVVVSFSEEVASVIGIDVKSLSVGYDNATELNINMFEATKIPNRIRLVETTDEVFALENYFRAKTAGADGPQLVTPDGELIYHKYEWVEVRADGSSNDETKAYIPVKDMKLDDVSLAENGNVKPASEKAVF